MKKLISCSIVLALASIAPIASAGHCPGKTKYTCEKGVKVYRLGLTPAQQQARDINNQEVLRRAAQMRADQALLAARNAQVQADIEAAYERGFAKGNEQTQQSRKRRNRYGYGRRYTTSYYGYGRRSFYYRPAYHNSSRR